MSEDHGIIYIFLKLDFWKYSRLKHLALRVYFGISCLNIGIRMSYPELSLGWIQTFYSKFSPPPPQKKEEENVKLTCLVRYEVRVGAKL